MLSIVLKIICIHGWAVFLCILVNNSLTTIELQGSNNIAALNIFCYRATHTKIHWRLRIWDWNNWKTFEIYKRSFCFVPSPSMNHDKSIYSIIFRKQAQNFHWEIPLESGSKSCSSVLWNLCWFEIRLTYCLTYACVYAMALRKWYNIE